MSINPSTTIKRLRLNPKKILDGARQGNIQDMTDLANFWQVTPELLDIFFKYLNPAKIPSRLVAGDPDVGYAFMAITGLTKAGNFTPQRGEAYWANTSIRGWPGLFEWTKFFVQHRLDKPLVPVDPVSRRGCIYTLTGAWYSISHGDDVQKAVRETDGSVELAVRLWYMEDEVYVKPLMDIPSPTACLETVLCESRFEDLNRVLCEKSAEEIANKALTRLRKAVNAPKLNGIHIGLYIDLTNQLSRKADHSLRFALLAGKCIQDVTKTLVAIAAQMNKPPINLGLFEAADAGFGYLRNCIESSDGFTWVSQAISSGLLIAFLDISPHLSKIRQEGLLDIILGLFKKVIPPYFVYRTVLRSLEGALKQIEKGPKHLQRVQVDPRAASVWNDFYAVANERLKALQSRTMSKGKAVTCDNVECLRVDEKHTFQRCGGCQSTLYCSKECQTIAWREQDHKTVCRLEQRERLEGIADPIGKADRAFFHHLAPYDATRQRSQLMSIASTKYPSKDLSEFVIIIDYTVAPATFDILPLDEHNMFQEYGENPQVGQTENQLGRSINILERAKDNKEKCTLLQSKIVTGRGCCQEVITMITGNFWYARPGADWGYSIEEVGDEGFWSLTGRA